MHETPSSSAVLDPKRPWINEPRELPTRLRWFETFFNPTGESPKLHFTRAWTVLFFVQLTFLAIVPFALAIIGLIGAPTGSVTGALAYVTPIVFILTTFMSFVIHARRLNDARKPVLLSAIVLLPIIVAGASFFGTLQSKAAAYDKLYEARAEYLENPAAWRAQKLEERKIAQAKAIEERRKAQEAAEARGEEASSGEAGQRGQRGGGQGNWSRGPEADQPLPDQTGYILKPALASMTLPIVGISFFIMFWSLMWLARKPSYSSKLVS